MCWFFCSRSGEESFNSPQACCRLVHCRAVKSALFFKGEFIGRDTFEWGGNTIHFSVVRSRRRKKTMAISVEPAGTVLVKVPFRLRRSRILEAVESRAEWILEKQKIAGHRVPPEKKFVSGDLFLYLGRSCRLKILNSAGYGKEPVRLSGGRLEVARPVEGGSKSAAREEIRDALVQWYTAQAGKKIPERVSLYARKMGLPEPEVLIRAQRTRWGSCDSKGRLRFNWRLIMAPLGIVDYVVVHELCHIKHKNHAASFWGHLKRTLPDCETRKERLRKEGLTYQF